MHSILTPAIRPSNVNNMSIKCLAQPTLAISIWFVLMPYSLQFRCTNHCITNTIHPSQVPLLLLLPDVYFFYCKYCTLNVLLLLSFVVSWQVNSIINDI